MKNTNRTAWFIERRHTTEPRWLSRMGLFDSAWTNDPNEAIQFCRKQDAEAFAMFNNYNILITEHIFLDDTEQKALSTKTISKELIDTVLFWTYCPEQGSYKEGQSVEDTYQNLVDEVEKWTGVEQSKEWLTEEEMMKRVKNG